MYCPNCGVDAKTESKFCRSCGMDLNIISQAITGQLQLTGNQPKPQESQRRQTAKWGFITFWGGIMLAALLAIMGDALMPVSTRLGRFVENLTALGGLVVMFGIGMMLYSLFLPKAQGKKSEQPIANPQAQPPQPRAQISAEPYRQPVGSVTESTTRLFEQSDSRTAARDASSQRE